MCVLHFFRSIPLLHRKQAAGTRVGEGRVKRKRAERVGGRSRGLVPSIAARGADGVWKISSCFDFMRARLLSLDS